MIQVKAAVISNDEIMPGARLIWLESPRIAPTARPGQFVMVRCGEGLEQPLRRPFSLHQRQDGKIALLFNLVGRGTNWLAQCQAGEELDLLGPLGNGFTIHTGAKKLLMIAGGIGIAPLRFLADEAVKRELSATLLLGAPTSPQLYPHHLLPPKVKLVTATEDGTAGEKGMITNILPDFINGADQVFACGPLPMYQNMARMPELKNKPVQVSLEVRMGCGLGICYGCTVKTKNGLRQVCKDGPIFELGDILWEELKGV